MNMKLFLGGALLAASFFSNAISAPPEIINVQYNNFQLWIDCSIKSAVKWQYYPKKDTGNEKRHKSFYVDDSLPQHCIQTSVGTYKTKGKPTIYDRGHLVSANSQDYDAVAIAQTNYMTNIVPMHKNSNRGAWLETELFVECRRDSYRHLNVIGGVYTGETPVDGDFTLSHGIKAPQAFWKVVTFDNQVIAWWVPNDASAKKNKVNDYLITVAEIEERTGVDVEINLALKHIMPTPQKTRTIKCNIG